MPPTVIVGIVAGRVDVTQVLVLILLVEGLLVSIILRSDWGSVIEPWHGTVTRWPVGRRRTVVGVGRVLHAVVGCDAVAS